MKIISICSGKGGVGKSTFAANLGVNYASRGLSTLLIDMNLGLRNLDFYLGLENNIVYDISDILRTKVSLKKALIRDKRFDSMYFLSTVQGLKNYDYDVVALENLLYALKRQFDIVIIDGPAGIGEGFSRAISFCDVAVIVATPDYVSLRDADLVNKLLQKQGITDRAYVINKVDEKAMGIKSLPSTYQIISTMKIDLIGVIQQDFDIQIANSTGKPAAMLKSSYIYRNFQKIGERLLWYG